MGKLEFCVAICLVLCSCQVKEDMDDCSAERMMHVSLSPCGTCADDTRSLLDSPDIEDRINDAVVAAYERESGILADVSYSRSDRYLMLDTSKSYNVYVIANMGNLSLDFPSHESGLELLKFSLPSFGVLASQGLPMAGMLASDWMENLEIEVRRLVAKVNVTLDLSDMDSGGGGDCFRGSVIKVHRAARILYPFRKGGSAAMGPEDLYQEVADYQTFSSGDSVETLTLYIPENMQGSLLDGNDDSWEKSESSDILDASLCTYISLEGVKDGSGDGVGGDFVYRFFPGEDSTRNFDLRGNRIYEISLALTWDGMYVSDNWKVEKSNWKDDRMIYVSTSEDCGYVSTAKLYIRRGASDVPVYICYSPHGQEYESEEEGGEGHHQIYGWKFHVTDSPYYDFSETFPQHNESELSGDYMSTGFMEHSGYRTVHYVTIPYTTPPGYKNSIVYMTSDGRHLACLHIEVVEADLPGLTIGGDTSGDEYEIEY